MNDDFATAMRRTLSLTRAGNLNEATRAIQTALNGKGGDTKPMYRPKGIRRPLGATVQGLRQRASRTGDAVKVDLPAGARFERRSFNAPEGARDYMLYVPACAPEEICGLVVMLHGCTQNAADFAAGTQMNTQGEAGKMLIAYPEQTQIHNANRCWNWFEPAHHNGTGGEPAILAAMAQSIAQEFALPAGSTFAAGLSAGGAMAAILGAERPDVFSAVGVHSGLAPKSARDVMSAFASMRGDGLATGQALSCPAIVFHGLADTTVAPVNASRLVGTILGSERSRGSANARTYQCTTGQTAEGQPVALWLIEGAGHAWSGGSTDGSYADKAGPSASEEMMKFFVTRMETTT